MHDVILDTLETFACPHCGEPIKAAALEPFTTCACPLCHAEVDVPGKFGQFLLLKRSGDGIMSVVFEARDPKLDRTVSLKILNYVLSKNQDLVEAFKREALAAAALNAPNVLKVFEYGMHNGQPFMVMEHLQGLYLNDWVREVGHDEIQIIDIVIGIVHGLSETHEAGILHGDVMPRNILISPEGIPKISDFGLARFSNQDAGYHESWSSPYYMPPERIRGEPEDHRGDLYSLGTTLFYLLTDHLPFFDLEDEVVRQRKATEDPPALLDYNPSVTPELADLTMRMIQREPHLRPRDHGELLEELLRIRPLVEAHVRQAEGNSPSEKPRAAPVVLPRKPFPWAMLLILLTGVLGAWLIYLRSAGDPTQGPLPGPMPTEPFSQATPAPQATRETVLNVQGASPLPEVAPLEDPTEQTEPEADDDPTRRLVSPTEVPRVQPTAAPLPPPSPLPSPEPTEAPAATPASPARALPARVLDLRADQADLKPFQRVPLWRDASPAGQHFRQNNPLLQPEIAPNAMGKEQALMFDGKFMTSTFTPRLATYTLLMVVKDAGSNQGSGARERVIVGVDPQAANAPRLLVYGDRDHPGSLVFKTDRGMARITLPLSERNRPFVLALRRDAEADTAFAGTHRATLTASPPEPDSDSASALPFLQLGGLAGQEKPFTGFIGSLLLLDRDLSDPELLSLFPALEKKYGITP